MSTVLELFGSDATPESVGVGSTVTSGWIDVTDFIAVTTYVRVFNDGVLVTPNRPLVTIWVARDSNGTDARRVLETSTDTVAAADAHIPHVHRITDRFIKVDVENPSGNANPTKAVAWADALQSWG